MTTTNKSRSPKGPAPTTYQLTACERVTEAVERTTGAIRSERGYMIARCPSHNDRTPSLSIKCIEDSVLVHCFAGCLVPDIMASLGMRVADLFSNPKTPTTGDTWMPCGHAKVAEYRYRDEQAKVLFGVARCERKCFRQWQPDQNPVSTTGRRWNVQGVRTGIIYKLPEIAWRVQATTDNIWVTEGEKDADRLWSLGIPATCNAGGAGKWTHEHAQHLAGADVVVVADRDTPGRKHAQNVVHTLMPLARSILALEPASPHKDISDHLDAGLGLHHLVQIAEPKPGPTLAPDGSEVWS